jgi:hypothetical protein
MSKPAYWNLVSSWQRKRLRVFNWIFRRRNDGRELQQLGATFWTVLRSVLNQIIFAVLLAAGLVCLDWKRPFIPASLVVAASPIPPDNTPKVMPPPAVHSWASPVRGPAASQSDWDFYARTSRLLNWESFLATPVVVPVQPKEAPKPVKAHPLRDFLAKLPFRSDAVAGILTTLAAVAATMLGLYFAAVSLVVSTSYNKVPGEVRALFVREQVGSHYFTFLAQFGANALLLLLAYAVGFSIGIWSVGCVLVLAVFGVFSFVHLGLRTFAFFDPAELVWVLNPTIFRSLDAVTAGGFRWEDPTFQAFHRRRGGFYLYCYDSLISLADQSTSSKGDSLRTLANNLLLGILHHYASIKSRIPSNSHWFQRVPKHKNWLTGNNSELEIARATDTGLQPELVADYNWFEQGAADLLAQIVHILLARGDYRSANAILTTATTYLEELGGTFKIQEALRLSRAFGRELDGLISKVPKDMASEAGLENCALYVSLFDVQGLGLISVLLGLAKTLRHTQPESISKAVVRVNWKRSVTLYETGERPRAVLEQWETLRENLNFEVAVSGRVVSPTWIQEEYTAWGYAQSLRGMAELWEECEKSTWARIGQHFGAKDFIGAAQIGLRGLETTNKFGSHMVTAREWYEGCQKLNRSRDRKWPEVDWADLEKRVQELRKKIIGKLADCAPHLSSIGSSRFLPDLFGQTYDALSTRCFDTLVEEDLADFGELFPKFFNAAFMAYERILREENGRERGLFKLSMGPIGDLMGLSGYAILTEAVTGKDFQSVVFARWETYMNQKAKEIPAEMGNLILMFEAGTDILLGMSPRETLRFHWKHAFTSFLNSKGINVGRDYFEETPVSHASPVLSAFLSGSDYYDSEVVFMASYLFKRPEAAGLKTPHKISDFWRQIERRTAENGSAEDEA